MHLEPSEADTLLTLAEIAVGLAGFSAIVVSFKRRDSGSWRRADADRFNGMVGHSLMAMAFCLLPVVAATFVSEARLVWAWTSGLLALQIAAHTTVIVFLASTGITGRVTTSLGGIAAVVLLAGNALGIGVDAAFGPYLFGVAWHLAHASVLFLMLVWVPADAIEDA